MAAEETETPSTHRKSHSFHRVPLLIVPGHGNSGPQHWQTWLEASHPNATRVVQKHWKLPVRRPWVAALDRLVRSRGQLRPVLVGHSIGAMTIAQWASRCGTKANIAGALLVAPPDLEAPLPGMPPVWLTRMAGWAPIPVNPLPWKSIVVASTNDPMCSLARSKAFAQAWGSELVEIGPAGHINDTAGYGAWPDVHSLIARLAT